VFFVKLSKLSEGRGPVNEKFQWFEFLLGVMVGATLETLFSLLEKL
jgi:hypothetical protein